MRVSEVYKRYIEGNRDIGEVDEKDLVAVLKFIPPRRDVLGRVLGEIERRGVRNKPGVLRFLIHLQRISMFRERALRDVIELFDVGHRSCLGYGGASERSPAEMGKYDVNEVVECFRSRLFNDAYYSFIRAARAALLGTRDAVGDGGLRVLEDLMLVLKKTRKCSRRGKNAAGKVEEETEPNGKKQAKGMARKNPMELTHLSHSLPFNDESFMFMIRDRGFRDYLRFIINYAFNGVLLNDRMCKAMYDCDSRWSRYVGSELSFKSVSEETAEERMVLPPFTDRKRCDISEFNVEVEEDIGASAEWYRSRSRVFGFEP
jgi:hypothetical protein